jgi:hypothetical protein
MLRVNEVNIARPPGKQIADVMKDAPGCSAAKTGLATTRTRAMGEVAAAMNDLGFGQIFGSRDAFGGIRQILSRAGHDKALLGHWFDQGTYRIRAFESSPSVCFDAKDSLFRVFSIKTDSFRLLDPCGAS